MSAYEIGLVFLALSVGLALGIAVTLCVQSASETRSRRPGGSR